MRALVGGFRLSGGPETRYARSDDIREEQEVQAWARVFRYGGSPGTFEALDRLNMGIDVRKALDVISVPTLVLHQSADPVGPG